MNEDKILSMFFEPERWQNQPASEGEHKALRITKLKQDTTSENARV